jgi:hypothetical protein
MSEVSVMWQPDLLLHQFHLFSLQQLLWNTLRIGLCAQTQVPELLTEFWSVFVEESGELNL